jgi:hypothetical protein
LTEYDDNSKEFISFNNTQTPKNMKLSSFNNISRNSKISLNKNKRNLLYSSLDFSNLSKNKNESSIYNSFLKNKNKINKHFNYLNSYFNYENNNKIQNNINNNNHMFTIKNNKSNLNSKYVSCENVKNEIKIFSPTKSFREKTKLSSILNRELSFEDLLRRGSKPRKTKLSKKELIYLKDKENFEEFLKGFKYKGFKSNYNYNNNNYNNNINLKKENKKIFYKPLIKKPNLSFNF